MTSPVPRGPKRPSVISPMVLADPQTAPPAEANALVTDDDDRRMVLIELLVGTGIDPKHVRDQFLHMFHRVLRDEPPTPTPVGRHYVRCMLTPDEIQRLVRGGAKSPTAKSAQQALQLIWRVWPDLVVEAHLDRSLTTIKADAAIRTYGSGGTGVVWAVLDSGIDAEHPHFAANGTLTADCVRPLHKDFTLTPGVSKGPLVDVYGHGTHVAGIIAGESPTDPKLIRIASTQPTAEGLPEWVPRVLAQGSRLSGVAPHANLVSLKVLDDDGKTLSSVLIDALNYVREINSYGNDLQIHGVNLSLGCGWMPRDYAAGQSPLCRELDLLTGSGVVCVVSAGNLGAGTAAAGVGAAIMGTATDVYGQLSTITDPGNAATAITVGSVHRYRPHTSGVTFDSSKGPTLDGRRKPDLVAPGERITSAATGLMAKGIDVLKDDGTEGAANYIEDSGTSMAAAHVSGAIAAFLSARTEFVGKPQEVKDIFLKSAVDLGRHEFFQGAGLVDLMRALSNT
ncbi:S8 family peptidase [Mycobacteroides immunogenum]|uniref:Serine peptidase n=1 Tax=Mycobacteroides immunogenum TaxID=83262 RepID=A0A7V8RVJ6_9MYCO|nr:S8 family peptidase [Mycobacteroides immunogenum]AMT72551.1 serine peptidase [Mycobacteroides immunogenum]ANO05713.1 serine peptidase [Mycobacteroides immunogenum]KIU41130.1 serine peptidase [Mycobacteroides immunogenum]KPG06035.1 serine peptidase [Mycobacteroides immunogenum]KPG07687.1 serine peptidase [Mycobacteroides immunogenum]